MLVIAKFFQKVCLLIGNPLGKRNHVIANLPFPCPLVLQYCSDLLAVISFVLFRLFYFHSFPFSSVSFLTLFYMTSFSFPTIFSTPLSPFSPLLSRSLSLLTYQPYKHIRLRLVNGSQECGPVRYFGVEVCGYSGVRR